MADLNPYAAGSHDASADTTTARRVKIDRYLPIAMVILACIVIISVRIQLKSTPTQVGMIPDADVGLTLTSKNPVVLFATTSGQDQVAVTRQDGTALSSDEASQASEIIEYLTQELAAGQNKNYVMIMGDADVMVGEVTRIQKIIGDAFEDIESTYIAVQEE